MSKYFRMSRVFRSFTEHTVLHSSHIHYKPNHLLAYYGGGAVSLPCAERLYTELLSLPLHPGLSDADVTAVCSATTAALEEYSR